MCPGRWNIGCVAACQADVQLSAQTRAGCKIQFNLGILFLKCGFEPANKVGRLIGGLNPYFQRRLIASAIASVVRIAETATAGHPDADDGKDRRRQET